jgi:hypothetical protein
MGLKVLQQHALSCPSLVGAETPNDNYQRELPGFANILYCELTVSGCFFEG